MKAINYVKLIFFIILSSSLMSKAYAESDPIVFLDQITNQVLQEIGKNKEDIESNNAKLFEIVDDIVLPHVDFIEMSKWVAGRTAWGQESRTIKESFVKEFKILVVNTYATALNKYTNERIEFKPIKNTNKKRIQVQSKIIRQEKDDVFVDYRLIAHDNTWKVYDVIIEGISILQGFRSQFNNDISKHGLEFVTQKIRNHHNE